MGGREGGEKNNIIEVEGGPYGSKAPVVARGASKSIQSGVQLSCLVPTRVSAGGLA